MSGDDTGFPRLLRSCHELVEKLLELSHKLGEKGVVWHRRRSPAGNTWFLDEEREHRHRFLASPASLESRDTRPSVTALLDGWNPAVSSPYQNHERVARDYAFLAFGNRGSSGGFPVLELIELEPLVV